MSVITNQLRIDASQGTAAIDAVTASFTKYNSAIGTVVDQQASFNRSGKNSIMVVKQIAANGDRVTTVLKKIGMSYRAISVTIAKETEAQKKAAQKEGERLIAQAKAALALQKRLALAKLAQQEKDDDRYAAQIIKAYKQLGQINKQLDKEAAASLAKQKKDALAATAQQQKDNDRLAKEAYKAETTLGKIRKQLAKEAAIAAREAAKMVIPNQLAAAYNRPAGTLPVKSTLVAENVKAYGLITEAQARAAAAARGFNAAQTDGFLASIRNIGKFEKTVDSVKDKFRALGSSIATFGKVAAFTVISTSVNRVQEMLAKGTREAVQYSRQIGLIQTLAKDSTDTYGKWNAAIVKTADTLAMPVAAVAGATYDALSNQVIKTSKDMNLIVVAGNLARNTNSQIGDSINVLSSIMNSYGPAAGSAQRISDELFTTVDLGRVRIDELNGVMGRSAGIARTAGVSLKELEAGLIVQTQAGLDSAESATLLNNVFSQLIKPNEALAAQFKKMGFNSGQAAVSTLGFAGVMRVLAEASKHSSDGIALFFPEIRGLRGAATFAGEGIDKFEQALEELTNAQGNNTAATKIMAENLGQNLIDQLQRSQNYFTNEWGMSFLETIAKITNKLGGLESILKTLATPVAYAGIAAAITAGFVALGFAIKTTYEAITVIKALTVAFGVADATVIVLGKNISILAVKSVIALGPLGLAIGAITLAIQGFNTASKIVTDEVAKDFEDLATKIKQASEDVTSNQIADFMAMTARMTSAYGVMVAKQKSATAESIGVATKAGQEIATNLTNNFQVIVQLAGKGVSKLEEMQKEAADRSVRIRKDRADLIMDYEQKMFDRQIGFYENEEKLVEKAPKSFKPDNRLLNQITDLKNARAEFQRMYGKKANVTGFDQDIRRTQAAIEQAKRDYQSRPTYAPKDNPIDQIVKLTTQRNNLLRQREAQLIDRGDLDGAKKALEEILSNLDKLDSHRDKNGRNQVAGLNAASRSEVQNYLDLTAKLDIKEQAKTVALAKQIEIEKQGVKTLEDRLKLAAKFSSKGAFDKEGKLLEKYNGDVSLAVDELTKMHQAAYEVSSSLKGITDPLLLIQYKAALEEMTKTFGAQKANLEERARLNILDLDLEKGRQQYNEILEKQNAIVADLTKNINGLGLGIDLNTNKAKAGLAVLLAQTQTLMGTASAFNRLVNIGTLQDGGRVDPTFLVETMSPLIENLNRKDKSKFDQRKALEQLDVVMEYVKSAGGAKLQITDPENNKETTNFIAYLLDIKKTLIELGDPTKQYIEQRKKLEESLSKIAETEKTMGDAIKASNPDLNIVVGKSATIIKQKDGIDKTAEAWNNLAVSIGKVNSIARELNKAKIPTPTKKGGSWWNWADDGGEVEGYASGGSVRGSFLSDFFGGKYAKGTDIIPAMLSKKEFVVRAPMAERYYSQLVAMNAGHAPVYRAQGGPVSNTQVGDIHITVPGGTGTSLRDLASQLRRGIKSGTVRIN